LETDHKRNKVRSSLKYSILDGSAYSAMLGLTQSYVTPLALELKATTQQIGLLASIPSLTIALSQLVAANLSERAGSRKRFILPVAFMHALMFIPVLLVHFLFHNSVWWLIGFVTLGAVFNSLANPAWGSMMADLVPERLRGRYFGTRGMIAGLITLVFFFIGGGILQASTGVDIFWGYAILFGGACLFRLISVFFLSRQYEPVQAKQNENSPGMLTLLKSLGSTNLGKFILFIALIDLCTNISAPFFSVFMLRDLHFSYLKFTIINSASSISSMLFLRYWGRRADTAGNMAVIRFSSIFIPIVPLFWLFSTNPVYLMGANVVSQFGWAGLSLCCINFAYDASEPSLRTKQLALFNATDLSACFVGSLTGGFIAMHLPVLFGYQLRSLFTLSGVLRAVVILVLLRRITEVRRVPKITTWQLLTGRFGNSRN